MGKIIKTAVLETQKRDAETAAAINSRFLDVDTRLNAEIQNRVDADKNLQNNLDAETKTRADDVRILQNNLDSETQKRVDADTLLQNNLDIETQKRIDADTLLQNNLDAEIKNREDALLDMKAAILSSLGDSEAAQSIQNDELRNEIQAAAREQSANLATMRSQLNNAISNHTTDINNLRAGFSTQLDALQQDLAAETQNRVNAVANLQSTLQNSINDEINCRELIVTRIQNSVTQNAKAIDGLEDKITAEKTARVNADNALQAAINAAVANLRDDLDKEIASRNEGDITLAQTINELVESGVIGNNALTEAQSKGFSAAKVYTYTGSSITPTINNFDSEVHTMTGDTSKSAVGTYTVQISPKGNKTWYDGTTTPISVTWKINAASVAIPTAATTTFTYDGSSINLSVSNYNTSYMSRSGYVSRTDAGNYSATYTLKSGYVWSDGTTAAKVINWTINPMLLDKPTATTTTFAYNGAAKNLAVDNYDPAYMTQSGTVSETNAGSYTATYTLKSTTNYHWKDNTTEPVTISWLIQSSKLKKPELENDTFTYTRSNGSAVTFTPVIKYLDSDIMNVTGTTSSNAPGTNTITVSFKDKDAYVWEDGTNDDVVLTWEIQHRVFNVSLNQTDFEYTGADISPAIEGFDPEYMKIDEGSVTAASARGTYTIKVVRLKPGASINGRTFADLTWNINSKKVKMPVLTKPTTPINYVISRDLMWYNGYDQCITDSEDANFYTVGGQTKTNTFIGTRVATFTLKDTENTVWEDGTTEPLNITWEVTPYILPEEFSADFVQENEVTYDGKDHNWVDSFPAAKALNTTNLNIAWSYIYGNVQHHVTDAGTYTYTLTLSKYFLYHDGSNADKVVTFTIKPAVIAKPTISSYTKTYNGNEQSPTIKNFNEDAMYYSEDSTLAATNARVFYPITICLKPNYIWKDGTTDDVAFNWKINPKPIQPPTAASTYFTYDGTIHALQVSNYNSDTMRESGTVSATEIGNYTATYWLANQNYAWADAVDTSDRSRVISWQIGSIELAVPTLQINDPIFNESEDSLTWYVYLQGFSSELISYSIDKTTNTKADSSFSFKALHGLNCEYFNSTTGAHSPLPITITFKIKDTSTYKWKDNTTADKSVEFKLPFYKLTGAYDNLVQDIPFDYDGTPKTYTDACSILSGLNVTMANSNVLYINRTTGGYSKQNAGVHTLKLQPAPYVCWADGTFGERDFILTINKIKPTFDAPAAYGNDLFNDDYLYDAPDLTPKQRSRLHTFDSNSDGELKVEIERYNAIGVLQQGDLSGYLSCDIEKVTGKDIQNLNHVTFTRTDYNFGSAFYFLAKIYYAEGTNYLKSHVLTLRFNIYSFFNQYSWYQIQSLIRSGELENVADLGATKDIELHGTVQMQIGTEVHTGRTIKAMNATTAKAVLIGVNHNSSYETGGENNAHFAIVQNQVTYNGTTYWSVLSCLESKVGKSDVDDTFNTYALSRLYVDNSFFEDNMEDKLQQYCYSVKKAIDGDYWTKRIFYLSEMEVYGTSSYDHYSKQYDFFANGNKVIARVIDSDAEIPVAPRIDKHDLTAGWIYASAAARYEHRALFTNEGAVTITGDICCGLVPCFVIV